MEDDIETDIDGVWCLNPKCFFPAVRSDEWTCANTNCVIMVRTFGTPAHVATYKWHARILEQAPEYKERFVCIRDGIRANIQENITSLRVAAAPVSSSTFRSLHTGAARASGAADAQLISGINDMLLLGE